MALGEYRSNLISSGLIAKSPLLFGSSDFITPESATDFEYEWLNLDPFVQLHSFNLSCIFDRFEMSFSSFAEASVLDVGCGNGRLGRHLVELSRSYVGIEPSAAADAFACSLESNKTSPNRALIVREQLNVLIRPESGFDVVVCWGVLHHCPNPKAEFERMLALMSETGVLLVYVYPKPFDSRGEFARVISKQPISIKKSFVDRVSSIVNFYGIYGDEFCDWLGEAFFCGRYKESELQKFQLFDGITPKFHWSLSSQIDDWAKARGFVAKLTAPGCFKVFREAGIG